MTGNTRKKRLIILDDDKTVCDVLLKRLRGACPTQIEAYAIHEPVAVPGFDIYVVDNSFGGKQEGIRLAEEIAKVSPGAAILMLSSQLEVGLLKKAIGLKVVGAFDKRDPSDVTMLVETVGQLARHWPQSQPGRGSIVRDLAALIREWNERMSDEEARRRLAS